LFRNQTIPFFVVVKVRKGEKNKVGGFGSVEEGKTLKGGNTRPKIGWNRKNRTFWVGCWVWGVGGKKIFCQKTNLLLHKGNQNRKKMRGVGQGPRK